MKNTLKKFTAVVLSLIMLCSALPFTALTAFADEPAAPEEYTLTLNQLLPVYAGEDYEVTYVKFVAPVSGTYYFTSYSESENDTYGYLFDSGKSELDSNDDGGIGSNFLISRDLTKGVTYYLGARWYSKSRSGEMYVTAVLDCGHTDADTDGICDRCGKTLSHVLTEKNKEVFFIFGGDEEEFSFTAPYSASYIFGAYADYDGYEVNVFDSDGNQLSDVYYGCAMEEEETYTVKFSSDYTGECALTVVHIHEDENEDKKCDICGTDIVFDISEGEILSFDLTKGESMNVKFACPEDGHYSVRLFNITSSNYNWDIYDTDGSYPDYDKFGNYILKEGETYRIELNAEYGDSVFDLTVVHGHYDEDGDCKCDECGEEFIATLTDGEPCDIEIEAGAYGFAKFTAPRTGEYALKNECDKGCYLYYEVFDGNGNYVYSDWNGECYTYRMTEGETYTIEFGEYEYKATAATVTITHEHIDDNNDGCCDICQTAYITMLKEDEPVEVEIEEYSTAEAKFVPDRNGRFYIDREWEGEDEYVYYYVYDSNGNSVQTSGYSYYDGFDVFVLNKDEAYTVKAYVSSGKAITATFTVWHDHYDDDGDGKCDKCGETLVYTAVEDEPVTVAFEKGSRRDIIFACERTDNYRIVYENASDNNWYYVVNDPDGEQLYSNKEGLYQFTKDETYTIVITSNPGEEFSADFTVAHSHYDENGDGNCDKCGKKFLYTLTEDEPCEIELETGGVTIATFTPDRDADFVFENEFDKKKYDVYYYVYDSEGRDVYGNYNDYNGDTAYSLNKDETYTLYIYEDYGRAAETTFTVCHAHFSESEPEIVVEPTLAACGVGCITCDTCGEQFCSVVPNTGVYYNTGVSGDFNYVVYSDENKENFEAAIYGYTGDGPELVIPSEIDGMPVTAVYNQSNGVACFNKAITSVVVPESVQDIEYGTFVGLTNLETVTINGAAIISDYVFAGCVNLKTVVLSENVLLIGDDAFDPDYMGIMGDFEDMTPEEKEEYLAEIEEQLADTEESMKGYAAQMEEEIASLEEYRENYFESYSERLGTEITSFDDIYEWIDAADDEAFNAAFNGMTREQAKSSVASTENGMNSYLTYMERTLRFYENYPDTMREIVAACAEGDVGIEKVIYGGSEEDWEKITICEGNENLTDAERSYDGEMFYYATFVADGKEVAKVKFTEGQKSIEEPAVPAKDGYKGKWAKYTLADKDITIEAEYELITYQAVFKADGKVVKKAAVAPGKKIPVPSNPTKKGYTFKGWSPKVPAKMPSKNLTFTAVFEPDLSSAKVKVKSDEVYKNSKVTVTAKGENIPDGLMLAVFDGKKEVKRGDNKSVTYEIPGEIAAAKKLTVKIVDADGNVQKNAKGEEISGTIEIGVKAGFFNMIIAFFKKLFGANKVTISA